jgi:hypothetical protein
LATSALQDFVETKILNRKVGKGPRKARKERQRFFVAFAALHSALRG